MTLKERFQRNAGLICENQFEAGVGGTAGSLSTAAGYGTPNYGHQYPTDFVNSKSIGNNSNTRLEVNAQDTDIEGFDEDEVRAGLEFELGRMNHKDKQLAKDIVIRHLQEDPRYYSNLDQLDINDDEDQEGDIVKEAEESGEERTKRMIDVKREMEKQGKSKEEIYKHLLTIQGKGAGATHAEIRAKQKAPTSRPATPTDWDKPSEPVDEITDNPNVDYSSKHGKIIHPGDLEKHTYIKEPYEFIGKVPSDKIEKAAKYFQTARNMFDPTQVDENKNLDVDEKELQKGIKVEMGEHGMSKEEATKTAMDHLTKESPTYYTQLQKANLQETSTCSTAPKVNLDAITSIMQNLRAAKKNKHI